MVQAIVDLSEHANRVVNVVKAKYGFRDKSEALEQMALEYEQEILEPELRPEFIKSVIEARQRGRFKKVKIVSEVFR